MFALRGRQSLAAPIGTLAVYVLRVSDIGNGRNDFPGYADAANGLVSCHVVGDQSEERGQRLGATASLGPGKLPDSLRPPPATTSKLPAALDGSNVRRAFDDYC